MKSIYIFLILLSITPNSFSANEVFPRVSVQFSDAGIGHYLYNGILLGEYYDSNLTGPSFKVGFGQHGGKFNASWVYSENGMLTIEAGISSYFINDDDEHSGNDKIGSGPSLEVTLSLLFLQLSLVQGKDKLFANFGIGF